MYKVLIIGAGGIGRRHVKGYAQTNRARLAVVEPDDGKRAAVASEFGISETFSQLSDENIDDCDLAVICTPAHVHVPIIERCANAGLPFLVEKPLAVDMDGVDAILNVVKQKNLLARVGYVRRAGAEVKALREQVLGGKIGLLKLVYLNSSQDFAKYRPDYRETYYSRPEMGGGAILDAASHLLDMLIWIVGKPTDVGCMFDRLALNGSKTEDTCLINIRFESGAMANVTINQFQKRNVASFEFIGSKGNLLLDHSRLKFAQTDSGDWDETTDYMEGLSPMEAHQARFAVQANAMLDALEGKPCDLATLEDAHQNLIIALAAKQSWIEKRIIRVSV